MEEQRRFFQFLAGERKGEVVVFDKIEEDEGIIFVCFKDGSRCNEELILPLNERKWSAQLMAEVESPSNVWTFKEEWVGRQEERQEMDADGRMQIVQPFIEGRKKVTPIPPKPTKSSFGQVNSFSQGSNTNLSQGTNVQQRASNDELGVVSNDPVYLMMDKAKKFDTVIEMNLIVSLPSKALYNVAEESFEEGGDKVIEYIIRNLDDQKLKDSLRRALKEAYGNEFSKEIKDSFNLKEPEAVEESVIGEPVVEKAKNKKEK
ncbi:MAG TPA: hypothetical protein PK122_00025 [Candidatus Paceibacterota bacterium]|nr:hypothetical protein [Candidatus Paceibacterota bacterium]